MNLLPRLRFNLRSFSTSRLLWNDKRFEELHIGKTLQSYKPTENEYVRCTIFNETGEMIHHDKDFKRSEFMKMHNLVPRDFRKISRHRHNSQLGGAASTNTQSNSSINVDIVPSIITRSNFVLLSLLNIRALIKHDSVVIFDNSFNSTHGSRLNESHTHSLFLKDMTERLSSKDKDLPYEFRAMESILIHVISNLTTEMKVHITVLQNILNGLENSIDRDKLRYLLIQSKKIAQFHQKTVLIRDLLNDILENDDELNEFYLSDSFRGVPRVGTNHAEIEVLFESYYMTCDEIVQTIHNLKSQIKTTEEIINMILDSNRNELMLLGLKYSTGLLSMGIALYCAALYGMNLENFIEETDGGFGFTVSLSCMLLFALLAISMRQLKRLHKVKMYGVKPR